MSAHNGDKARHHRLRKRTIRKRQAIAEFKKEAAKAAEAKAK